MLKNILKMEGAKTLSKNEQKNLMGGFQCPNIGPSNCDPNNECCKICSCGTNNVFWQMSLACPSGYHDTGSSCV